MIAPTEHVASAGPEEAGAAGLEVVALGVLVFVVGALVLLAGWRVVDAKFATAAAAREATRAFVEASGTTATARSRAHEVGLATLRDYGVQPREPQVAVDGTLARCQPVQVTVSLVVPGPALPWVGRIADVGVQASHAELVDPLRAGLEGEAGCVG
jgi:hypothetical protein